MAQVDANLTAPTHQDLTNVAVHLATSLTMTRKLVEVRPKTTFTINPFQVKDAIFLSGKIFTIS